MRNHPKSILFGILAAAIVFGRGRPAAAADFFQTSYQNEAQYLVESIVSDIAEQTYYAAKHKLPDTNVFMVKATETSKPTVDSPTYDVTIDLDAATKGIKLSLNVNGPIWSPAVYADVTAALAKAVGLKSPAAKPTGDLTMLGKLFEPSAMMIEQENSRISKALDKDFTNPELHEQAALLLGAFLMRNSAAQFPDLRAPLSRMTAHLALSRFFAAGGSSGVNGRLAESLVLVSGGNQVLAQALLKTIEGGDTNVARFVRVVRTLCDWDPRPLANVKDRSLFEDNAWLLVSGAGAGINVGWQRLSPERRVTIEIVRTANQRLGDIGIGHQLLQLAIPLEMQEIQYVYSTTHSTTSSKGAMIEALNHPPERCFSYGPGGEPRVRVIGWGQWAWFLQQQLCSAVERSFNFMYRRWGVPDEAKQFAAQSDAAYEGLRLYPFVRRINATTVAQYHSAVDDAVKVVKATPQLVPPPCWSSLVQRLQFPVLYTGGDIHTREWFSHGPPPGTPYCFDPELHLPAASTDPDYLRRLERAHELAPWELTFILELASRKYHNHPTSEQAMELCKAVLPVHSQAARIVAATVQDSPERWEDIMGKAALFDPTCYYDLASYAIQRNLPDRAEQFYLKAEAADRGSVQLANHSEWRVRYYLDKKDVAKARELADFAGEVYSHNGLVAKAVFFELTKDYDSAFEWFAKVEERYDKSWPLIKFIQRFQAATDSGKFDAELRKREHVVFAKGIQKVSLADLRGPPPYGVRFTADSDLLKAAKLKKGDIIVAIDGVRVQWISQYNYVRRFLQKPELDLIVWQGDGYYESKSSPPKHLFGVGLDEFDAQSR